MTNSPTATMTITGTYVIVNLDERVLYCWMLVVAVACIIVCTHILLRCHRRNKTLDKLQSRVTRRQNGITDNAD